MHFNYQNIKLTTLVGIKYRVANWDSSDHSFDFSRNQLTNLSDGPRSTGLFRCSGNQLTSLEFCPNVTKSAYFVENNLTTVDYLPNKITGTLDLSSNKIKNLKDIHKMFNSEGYLDGDLRIGFNPLSSHILGLILIPKLKTVTLSFFMSDLTEEIINKHLETGGDVLDCQEELIQNDLKDFAKL